MVDLVITAANVVKSANVTEVVGTSGATITAGKVVYKDTDSKWKLADSNHATAVARQAIGIALNGASPNQPVSVAKGGELVIGGTMTLGAAYYLSDTPGGICPVADVGAGEYVCLLGFAKTTTVLALGIQYPNVSV